MVAAAAAAPPATKSIDGWIEVYVCGAYEWQRQTETDSAREADEKKMKKKIQNRVAQRKCDRAEKNSACFPIYPFLLSSDSIDFPIIFLGTAEHQCIVRCMRANVFLCVVCLISENWKRKKTKNTHKNAYICIHPSDGRRAKAIFSRVPSSSEIFSIRCVLVILFQPAHCNLCEPKFVAHKSTSGHVF